MPDTEIQNPTYMADIRHFFRPQDIGCMAGLGIDLATYEGVKFNAMRIYFKVRDGEMPEGGPAWSKARTETFYNWMKNDYPRGTAAPQTLRGAQAYTTDDRFMRAAAKRVDAATLTKTELEKLTKAFTALMTKPETDPDSFFAIAGLHWLPKPNVYCRHHENAYNPWHRAYLLRLEDALRRVPGCEDLSMPYWDITAKSIPDFLFQPPFDRFTFPTDLYDLQDNKIVSQGDKTNRFDATTILANLERYKVADNIEAARGHSHWERFNGWIDGRTQDGIIRAHDLGHNATGPTMQSQDIAAFDPIFWFFHANWDRLWWEWQLSYSATTLATFKTHLINTADWLDDPVLNGIAPFPYSTADMINLANFNVTYEKPKGRLREIEPLMLLSGSMDAEKTFQLGAPKQVSIRAKDIDRLKIPGSFDVALLVDDEEIARTGMFQSATPQHCATCRKAGLANFDFLVDLADLKGPVSIKVLLHRNGKEQEFPLNLCGCPTVNARLLLA